MLLPDLSGLLGTRPLRTCVPCLLNPVEYARTEPPGRFSQPLLSLRIHPSGKSPSLPHVAVLEKWHCPEEGGHARRCRAPGDSVSELFWAQRSVFSQFKRLGSGIGGPAWIWILQSCFLGCGHQIKAGWFCRRVLHCLFLPKAVETSGSKASQAPRT